MENNATLNQETINRLNDEGTARDLNLACNSEACYVAISEYELVHFATQDRADSPSVPANYPAPRF